MTRNLTFWERTVGFNKYLVGYRWLTKLTHYVFFVRTCIHVLFLHTHTHTRTHTHTHTHIYIYIFIFIYCPMFYCKPWKKCTIIYGWIQNYSARSFLSFGYKNRTITTTSEASTIQICHGHVQILLFVIKILGFACGFRLWRTNLLINPLNMKHRLL